MVTHPIFYRLFETSPETFFLLLGMSDESAKAMAARYQYQSLEFKETAHRVMAFFAERGWLALVLLGGAILPPAKRICGPLREGVHLPEAA